MNGNKKPTTPITDASQITGRNFDRLVDGEMSETERQALLSQLDNEPQGWRQCALAFLESQCFRESLAPLGRSKGRAEIEAAESAVPTAAQPKTRTTGRRQSFYLLTAARVTAMAASFFFAMGLGWWVRPLWYGQEGAAFSMAQNDPAKRDLFPAAGSRSPTANMSGIASDSDSPWQMVTVSIPGNEPGQSEAIQVPAVERTAIDNAWLSDLPGLPPEVLAALQSMGHQVQQSRELVPVQLEDGRHLVVPMDQIELRYVGHDEYQ